MGTDATLTVRPASPGGIHIADWAISIARGDGSSEQLAVPDRLVSVPASIPKGPPRNVATLYRLLAEGITDARRVTPDFATAVYYHQILDAIQQSSETGTVQAAAAARGTRNGRVLMGVVHIDRRCAGRVEVVWKPTSGGWTRASGG